MINTYDVRVSRPEYFKQIAANDLLILHYKCPQVDKQVYLFTHYNEIVYTLNGKKTLHHGHKAWELTDNKSLFVKKTAYKQEMDEIVGWEVLSFSFQDEFLKQVYREYRQQVPLKHIPPPSPEMLIEINVNEVTRAFFYSIIPYFTQSMPLISLELKFKELFFNLFADPANLGFTAYVNSIADQHKTPLCQVMEGNFMYNLSIAEFAKIAHRSITGFKKEFADHYKTTPGKWLLNKRLELAKSYLDSSKKSVTDIAYDCGFENTSHFSRVFKEKYGASPLQYRKHPEAEAVA